MIYTDVLTKESVAFNPLLGPGKAEFSHQPVESKVYSKPESNPLLATVLPKVNFRIFNIHIFIYSFTRFDTSNYYYISPTPGRVAW